MKQELKFIYNSQKYSDRKTLGYATSLNKHVINEFDISKDKLTSTQLFNIASLAGCSLLDLVDKDHDYYKDSLKNQDLDDNGIATVIMNDHKLLRTPIIVTEDEAYVIRTSYDLNKIDMAMEGLAS